MFLTFGIVNEDIKIKESFKDSQGFNNLRFFEFFP